MKKRILLAGIALFLIAAVIVGVFAYRKLNSPEYALYKTFKDVKAQGVDGLLPHLTSSARGTVEKALAISENPFLSGALGLLTQEDKVGFLKESAQEIEFSLKDVLRGSRRADVVIGFDYKGKITGSIDIVMVKQNGEWKISTLQAPKFEKIGF